MRKVFSFIDVKFAFRIALRYSFILAFSFVAVLTIAKVFGWEKITAVRFINYILFYPIAFAAINKAYESNDNFIDYFSGLMVGFLTGALGQLWFCILFFVYLHIDNNFFNFLVSLEPQNVVYQKLAITVVLFIEGFVLSTILSLTLMQYFKWKQGRWNARA